LNSDEVCNVTEFKTTKLEGNAASIVRPFRNLYKVWLRGSE